MTLRFVRELRNRMPDPENWTYTTTRGGHLRITHPCGAMVIASQTPSNSKALRNTIAEARKQLRQKGIIK